MKVLFAVSNENISESIIKKYQQMYKEIIVSKNVYYFNAIIKELQKDKSYDRVVISEDLEPFTNNNYDTIDNFIFEKLDNISDEAATTAGEDIPIILIATDRRTKSDNLLIKLFGIGVYSALLGQDRSIDEVCKLINKPRSKKEAKIYYQIDSNEVEYKPENEGDVSESEIQNILAHYRKLGKNEERYIESFDNIALQYTDQQLKVIIKFLPLNVKAVLEENSPRYQQLMAFGNKGVKKNNYNTTPNKIKNDTEKAISNSGIKIESIPSAEKKLTKPVIIPSVNKVRTVKSEEAENRKRNILQRMETIDITDLDDEIEEPLMEDERNIGIEVDEPFVNDIEIEEPIVDDIEIEEPVIDDIEIEEPVVENVVNVEEKRKRGRPRKIQTEEETKSTEPKRRGRPRKNPVVEEIFVPEIEEDEEYYEEDDDINSMMPGFEEVDTMEEESATMPGWEDEEEVEDEDILPGFEEDYDDNYDDNNYDQDYDSNDEDYEDYDNNEEEYETENINNYEESYEEDNEATLPGFDQIEEEEEAVEEDNNPEYYGYSERLQNLKEIQSYQTKSLNLENLLSKDKKIVAFIGTTKNGTSFLINNLAEMLSSQGIKTAILDLTKNRNAYYIYTKNEEELRKIAFSCTEKLTQGIANGIKVNKNLDVYTSLPGENDYIEQYDNILETLVENYSLVLLDCDFNTRYEYLREVQEIYLVQTMDVLTIQPLTAYLRDLKAKGVLNQNKLKVVINKYTKVRSVTEKTIIGGMAFYNDPAMSFMTELFNRETIPYCTIPFDMQVYTKYLEGLINCSITTNGYPKESVAALRKLANMVYPLIGSTAKYNNPKYNKYASNSTFSNEMNSTLDKMKRNY